MSNTTIVAYITYGRGHNYTKLKLMYWQLDLNRIINRNETLTQ